MDTPSRIRAAVNCVPEFAGYGEKEFFVEPLRGGLTNLLWMVGLKNSKNQDVSAKSPTSSSTSSSSNTNPSSNSLGSNSGSGTDTDDDATPQQGKRSRKDPRPTTIALVREYGRGTESFMNRLQEERIVQRLCEEGLCPTVYGVYPWGRVERYLSDSRTLSTTEYASPEYLPKVARLLGQFHAHSSSLTPLCTDTGKDSRLGHRLYQWFKIASSVRFEGDDPEDRRKHRKLEALDLNNSVKTEIEWFLKEVSEVKSPVVFCHCDLQEGNVLLHGNQLHMIDFEYSDRLERGFDFGNCFCEMAIDYQVNSYPGFIVYPDSFPDEAKQIAFLRAYADGAGLEFNEGTERQLLREANLFIMGSHLHWAIWSVVQGGNSTIDFGYMEYAEQRMDQYYFFKRRVWPNMKSAV